LRILKKCTNRSLIEGLTPFLESTSTPLLHGRQQKKSKEREAGGKFSFLGPIWQSLKARVHCFSTCSRLREKRKNRSTPTHSIPKKMASQSRRL